MVQLLLTAALGHVRRILGVGVFVFLMLAASGASKIHKGKTPVLLPPPDILLEGGRKLSFESSFQNEKEVLGKPGFWTKVLNVVAGDPEYRQMARPYGIAVDSRGRMIVTDPGAAGVHIFDFAQHKYKFIERQDKEKDPMRAPQCVALDAQDNIYVTDSESGKIFVFDPSGKFRRTIGSLKGGEGFFKRPTGISVDSAARRIYITDTLRDTVFVLDMNGSVLKTIGEKGSDKGQFNFPTEVLLHGPQLYVVDAMNFRVQAMDRDGTFQSTIGQLGDAAGTLFRPKGVGVDSEGHIYVVDGFLDMVQVFNAEGHLLYYFGENGTALGKFHLPTGLFIDHQDRIFVVDSYNHRVQVFRYSAQTERVPGQRR